MTPLPVLEIDWHKYPELADNIWHAQMTGRARILTYNGPNLSRDNRRQAMHFELDGQRQEVPHILSRDEYPFACTVEGGAASWVGHIPGKQNSAQGGLLAGFIREKGIVPGDPMRSKFEVRIKNHPRGPVTRL